MYSSFVSLPKSPGSGQLSSQTVEF